MSDKTMFTKEMKSILKDHLKIDTRLDEDLKDQREDKLVISLLWDKDIIDEAYFYPHKI